ncbi:unnamed protein product [Oncorhynchus mykiss]|uniref:Guanylate cyclase domain-containing protein n=3 Tax=Oncorhynchus TaxID=8016 RepID=A0A060Z2W8_ONCMY|nr:unnamed protein product [Oncorhynchus mykiss]
MQIHISQTTKDHLEHEPYIIEERGKIFVKGKGYMKTYWLKGKKDLSFKTPAELRYSSEQKDSEDRSSNGSTCTNTKRSTSNLNIPNEEQAEGKPTPTELPAEPLPSLEGAPEDSTDPTEPQEKKVKKNTKNNNKGGAAKPEAPPQQVNVVQESAVPPAAAQETPTAPPATTAPVLNNKRNSFRQHTKLPAHLPMRSTSCCLL